MPFPLKKKGSGIFLLEAYEFAETEKEADQI